MGRVHKSLGDGVCDATDSRNPKRCYVKVLSAYNPASWQRDPGPGRVFLCTEVQDAGEGWGVKFIVIFYFLPNYPIPIPIPSYAPPPYGAMVAICQAANSAPAPIPVHNAVLTD